MAEEGRQRANQQRGADDSPGQAARQSMQPDTAPKARVPSPALRTTRTRLASAKGWPKAPP